MQNRVQAHMPSLLTPDDPAPVEVVNPNGASPVFLLCEHAGQAVPSRLAGLGLDRADMEKHIAWDIGAEAVARRLSALMDAPLVVQRYSRLVIDANRPFSAHDSVPEISDGIIIPGNQGLSPAARAQRQAEIHQPLHDTVARMLDARAATGKPGAFVSIHSFTALMNGLARPMAIGLLFNRDSRLALALQAAMRQTAPDALVALNAPYSVNDDGDYAIPVHAETRGLPHALLEVRNDLIDTPAGQDLWADRLARALKHALSTLETTP